MSHGMPFDFRGNDRVSLPPVSADVNIRVLDVFALRKGVHDAVFHERDRFALEREHLDDQNDGRAEQSGAGKNRDRGGIFGLFFRDGEALDPLSLRFRRGRRFGRGADVIHGEFAAAHRIDVSPEPRGHPIRRKIGARGVCRYLFAYERFPRPCMHVLGMFETVKRGAFRIVLRQSEGKPAQRFFPVVAKFEQEIVFAALRNEHIALEGYGRKFLRAEVFAF